MISRREQEGGKEEEGTKQEKRPGEILADGESGKKTLLPSLSRALSSLLSLERRDPTRAGLNWAGLVDGEQGRGRT